MSSKVRVALVVLPVVLALAGPVAASSKPCEELKGEIATKLAAKHVVGYHLQILANDEPALGQVVGTCEGHTHRIAYTRGGTVHASSLETQKP